ncbi:MAG: hypothetical protein V2A79_09895 [Planctomycetota bacterium]
MAWVRVESGLRDHPKVLKLARDTGCKVQDVVGQLVSLWLWCIEHAQDGDLRSFDADDIEAVVGWTGESGKWYAAAVNRHLIDVTADGAQVHDWQDWMSSWTEAQRKRDWRQSKVLSCPVNVPDSPGQSRQCLGQSETLTKRPSTAPDRSDLIETIRSDREDLKEKTDTDPIGSAWLALRERVRSVFRSDRGTAAIIAWLGNVALPRYNDQVRQATLERLAELIDQATTKDTPAKWFQWAAQRPYVDGGINYRPRTRHKR